MTGGQQRVGQIMGIPPLLREFGVDPAGVLAEAGLAAGALDDPDGTVPFVSVGHLLQICVERTGCAHFGLLIGTRTTLANFGAIGQLMGSAPTLGGALLDFVGNQHRFVRGGVPYLLAFGDTAVLGYAIFQPGVPGLSQFIDGALAVAFGLLRELAEVAPDEAMLAHAAPADPRPYHKLLGVRPRFDAEQTAVTFSTSLLQKPVRTADPVLRSQLQERVRHYWLIAEPDLRTQLLRLLRPMVVLGTPSVDMAAAQLSMHPRTLNRRLNQEGTSFREVLNGARFEVARQLLTTTRLAITDIAIALGYADGSVFTHAFQRWAGVTPSDWRAAAAAV